MPNYTALMKLVAKRQPGPGQVQSASLTSPTTDSHESDAQASMISGICALLQTLRNQFQRELATQTQTPIARAAALSAIDKEIDASKELTRTLFSNRNALAPISALPPELLARIFHFHALAVPPWSAHLHGTRLGWIVVTHVCQRWRQIALDDSSLWPRISGSSWDTKWLTAALFRAQNVPLVIDLVCAPDPWSLDELLPLIPRTRELRLRGLSLLHSQAIQRICRSEAPELEHFELGAASVGFPVPSISETRLFKGRCPKLRVLDLSQVYIPWSSISRSCCQLTQLKITLSREVPISYLSSPDGLGQLVDLLSNSPGLKVLVLSFCLPTILSRVSPRWPINLPRLSHLCLGGLTSRVMNLLKKLILPSSTTLHLHCISDSGNLRLDTPPTCNDDLILPLITAHFHNPAPVEFKSIRVTAKRLERFIEVAAYVSPFNSTLYDPHVMGDDIHGEAQLLLSFDGLHQFGPSNQAVILRRLCNILPMSNIEFLSISAPDEIGSVNWFELFQRCKKVTTIEARGRGIRSLLAPLASSKPANSPYGSKGKRGNDDYKATQAPAANVLNPLGGSQATTTTTATTPFTELKSLFLENVDFNAFLPHVRVVRDANLRVTQDG